MLLSTLKKLHLLGMATAEAKQIPFLQLALAFSRATNHMTAVTAVTAGRYPNLRNSVTWHHCSINLYARCLEEHTHTQRNTDYDRVQIVWKLMNSRQFVKNPRWGRKQNGATALRILCVVFEKKKTCVCVCTFRVFSIGFNPYSVCVFKIGF